MRKFNENSIVLATHNMGKFEEMKKLLDDGTRGISVYSSNEFEIDEPEEVGTPISKMHGLKQGIPLKKLDLHACLMIAELKLTVLTELLVFIQPTGQKQKMEEILKKP